MLKSSEDFLVSYFNTQLRNSYNHLDLIDNIQDILEILEILENKFSFTKYESQQLISDI